jgi:hypothetical protein
MMDDSEIRDRFAELREADRVRAPGFAQTFARARARESWRATRRVRPLVIATAAAVLIAAVWRGGHSRSFSPSTTTSTIATWRAPTDVLLTTPGSELFRTMPALGASVLDKMIHTPSEKGA